MKKVIEQEVFTNVYIEVTSKTLHFIQKSAYPNSVVIEKSKSREVALAIDPEYQKVIDALNTLVQLKDIKGIPEMAEKYGSMKPKAWEQARQILKELNV